MKKILITGAGGFVATHLIDLLEQDYSIVGLIHSRVPEAQSNVEFIKGDIRDLGGLSKIIAETAPDVIVHLAGQPKVWASDIEEIFQTNFFGTLNLYEAIVAYQKKDSQFNPKILFIGSSEVYGKTNRPEDIHEDDLLNPLSLYASSKVAADRLSFQYSQTHKLNIAVVRPFLHTGPGQQKGFFAPDMISQIVEMEKGGRAKELMVGNLESVRECNDVRDVVRAYKLLIENDFESGEVFNICGGKGYKMSDVLNKIIELMGIEVSIKQDPSRMRPSDVPIIIGNNTKFVKQFGWKSEYSIEQTLTDEIEYWRKKA